MASRSTAIEVAPRGIFALALLTGAVCGVASARLSTWSSLGFFFVFGGMISWAYGKRFGLLALGALICGIAAAEIQIFLEKPLDPGYGHVVVRLADANQSGVSGLPPQNWIGGTLRRGGGEIPVAVQLPRGSRTPPYGAVLEGVAAIAPPPDAATGFGASCAAHRYRGIVRLSSFQQVGEEPGFLGKLLKGRDFLLGRVTASMVSDDARAIGAALLFGVRSGMKGELRQKFVDAGTVHLFSVSGMHVAVVAAILLFLLRMVPLTPRYLSIVALLGVYTLITGANPPAVRAFFLIAAWACGRAFLREVPAVEILGIVGAGMLWSNPALIGDVGAQYSFFITAILLAAGEFCRHERVSAAELLMSGNVKKQHFARRKRIMLFPDTLLFCTIAFAGSIGITLLSGNDLRPWSIVANLLFTVGAVPLFAVGLAAMVFPAVSPCFGALLLGALHWCEICGEIFPPLDYAAPRGWEVALFMFCLLITFFAVRRIVRGMALLTATAFFCSWLLQTDRSVDEIAFFQGDSRSPGCVVIVEKRFHRAVCVNLPDFRARAELEKFLRRCGVTSIEKVFLTENHRRNCGCLAQLKGVFRPRRLIASDGKISGNFLAFLEERALRNDLERAYDRENGKISPCPGGFTLDYFLARDKVNLKLVLRDGDGGREVTGTLDGRVSFNVKKLWAKNPKVWSYDVRIR